MPQEDIPLSEKPIAFETPKTEVFFSKSMTPSAVHHMILRLVAEKVNLHQENDNLGRRYSDEQMVSGGRATKLRQTTEIPLIEKLRAHFASRSLKLDADVGMPWYLDTNMTSLADSLKCFRMIMTKYACAKEKIVFKNYTVSRSELEERQRKTAKLIMPLLNETKGAPMRR